MDATESATTLRTPSIHRRVSKEMSPTEIAVTELIQKAFERYGGKGKTGVRILRERNEEDRIRNIVAARRLRGEGGDLPQVLGREG